MNGERVLTFASKNDRGGIYISKNHYDVLSEFILSALEEKEEMSLPLLLEEASRHFFDFSPGDLHWHFLRVKYDLEVKGLIITKIERQPYRTQLLKKKRKDSRGAYQLKRRF